jgi:hypothetical protein
MVATRASSTVASELFLAAQAGAVLVAVVGSFGEGSSMDAGGDVGLAPDVELAFGVLFVALVGLIGAAAHFVLAVHIFSNRCL